MNKDFDKNHPPEIKQIISEKMDFKNKIFG